MLTRCHCPAQTTLVQVVRAVFEPNEYPSSMERLYQWTPDECLPDFYDESAHNNIFQSLHANMTDLKPPAWAASPQDFLRRHRQASVVHLCVEASSVAVGWRADGARGWEAYQAVGVFLDMPLRGCPRAWLPQCRPSPRTMRQHRWSTIPRALRSVGGKTGGLCVSVRREGSRR
jgi:hypothetical protein